jgi:proline dehydrogenase
MSALRQLFVKASESAWLRKQAPRIPFVRRAASRFLPGEDVDAAIAAAHRLARDGISILLTHLGENVSDRAESESITHQYLDLLARIHAESLPAEISVKLTQLGLDVDRELCAANLGELLSQSSGKTVWIDMEQSSYVDATLELYGRVRREYLHVGVCVQSYLHRTAEDVAALISMGASVRLVKGAYSEPREIAYSRKLDVDESFFRLAQALLGPAAQPAGVRAVIATHDRRLIARITEWAVQQGIATEQLEFAMLYGIQRAEQLRLARAGYRSDVLISYGSFWFPWYMRRLAERPANILFIARNLFSS